MGTPYTSKWLTHTHTLKPFVILILTFNHIELLLCRYSSLNEIDVERLFALINKSFDKTLRQDYIDSLKGRLHSIYLSERSVQIKMMYKVI